LFLFFEERVILGFELRASRLLSRRSNIWCWGSWHKPLRSL
jgi:hypothetical protein